MASDFKKTMDITSIFTNKDIEDKIWPLSVDDMYLIGKSTAQFQDENGIHNIDNIVKIKIEKS